MNLSRLSTKGQVTIPKAARAAIGLKAGDLVSYEVQDGVLLLRRAQPFDAVYHESLSETLEEWNSPEDEEAFSGL